MYFGDMETKKAGRGTRPHDIINFIFFKKTHLPALYTTADFFCNASDFAADPASGRVSARPLLQSANDFHGLHTESGADFLCQVVEKKKKTDLLWWGNQSLPEPQRLGIGNIATGFAIGLAARKLLKLFGLNVAPGECMPGTRGTDASGGYQLSNTNPARLRAWKAGTGEKLDLRIFTDDAGRVCVAGGEHE